VRALLIANVLDSDAGFVGHRFREHGFSFSENHRERLDDWIGVEGHDLVVLLGSEWSVYWPENAVATEQESALIRNAQRRGVPMFGICYGSQMISHALGGTVERAREPEIGWMDVTSDIAAVASGPWMQWHYDCFTPPPGAEELGRSAVGSQILRIGRTFATQFHPEANEAMIAYWARSEGGSAELQRLGRSADELLDITRKNVIDSEPNAHALVDWFLDNVAGS
jgi:GMP synthase-like glutamine amidotransferase